jgi:hypothetical protein
MRSQIVSQTNRVRACSACSGDYEDPEQIAWNDAGEDEDAARTDGENAEPSIAHERFPVREE